MLPVPLVVTCQDLVVSKMLGSPLGSPQSKDYSRK